MPESVFRRDVAARTAGAISASAGGYAIADTSTTAKVGDIYRAETATTSVMVGKEYPVIAASTNSFTIASKDLPVLGDTFYVLGPVTLRTASDGSLAATISGSATEAKQDAAAVLIGALTESAPGTDTASSGLNGRLQRIAQRLTSLIALIPASLGQKNMANSLAVALASDQASVPVAATLTAETTKVIGTVNISATQNIQVSNSPTVFLAAGTNNIGDVDVLTLPAIPTGTNVIGRVGIDQTTPGTTNLVALAANQSVNVAQMNGVTTLMGAGTDGTGSQRVTHSSGASGTSANVASSASNVTILAASTSRLGAAIFNDSTAVLYIKFGATASTTSYITQIASNGYYELPGPHIYNGIIDGIWSAANGNARVTSW